MVGCGNSSTGAVAGTDRPVLLECGGTLNGWLIGLSMVIDSIAGSITGDGSNLSHLRTRIVIPIVLKNIVLNKRICGPAVDTKISIPVGTEVGAVGDGPNVEQETISTIWHINTSEAN